MLTKASASSFGQPVADPPQPRPPRRRPEEITQAVQAFTARRIQKRLEETIEIPPLADTAQKIIKLRVDPNATIDDITGVVETDPALAAQVVSWAASPYYASPGKIRSVEDAIVRVLGFDLVINLALGLALGKTLSLPKDHPQQATPYWQQSIYTAAVIEGLTRAMPRPAPGSRPDLPRRAAAQLRLPAAGPRVPAALLADLPPPGGQPAPVPQLCGAAPAGHQPRADRRLADEAVGHARRAVHRPALPARPGLRRRVRLPQPGVPGRAPAALAASVRARRKKSRMPCSSAWADPDKAEEVVNKVLEAEACCVSWLRSSTHRIEAAADFAARQFQPFFFGFRYFIKP
jgi:hypothetical protein